MARRPLRAIPHHVRKWLAEDLCLDDEELAEVAARSGGVDLDRVCFARDEARSESRRKPWTALRDYTEGLAGPGGGWTPV